LAIEVQLAGDLGYGIPWLIQTLIVAIVVATAFFVYVALSTKSQHSPLAGFDRLKYKLHKYNAERYWAIFVAGVLIWFWIIGYPWMPPVAFSDAIQNEENVHTVKITAGQWFWRLEDGGYGTGPSTSQPITNKVAAKNGATEKTDWFSQSSSSNSTLKVKAGETVKFVARTQDVNHGFGILSSSNGMDTPLMQMQVVPGYDNVFYFTFDKPGAYTIRCLEYCGWQHPLMVSQITIEAV
jgi:heme/copper-type cytochrome/quinol oxidase subunit 2